MEDNNHHGSAFGWFFVGGIAGACAALLLAPAAGKRTRERLARRVRDTKETVTDFTNDLADTTRDLAERAGRIGDKAVRMAGDASAAARNVADSLGLHAARSGKG
jgi:gas vesicle protein